MTTGTIPDTEDDDEVGFKPTKQQTPHSYTYWNPLPAFPSVKGDLDQWDRLQDTSRFYIDAKKGTLPQICWIIPSHEVSEHPTSSVKAGMAYVTGLVNAVMKSPDWKTSAIFIAWDDWGGFYDHVVPPKRDQYGLGIRVPGLVIRPYAKEHYIDHDVHSFESWLKIIEERFGIQPLTQRDTEADDMLNDFDFSLVPRPPVTLAATPEGSKYPHKLQVLRHEKVPANGTNEKG